MSNVIDVQCDNGNTFEAIIVLPKMFVIQPEFNDLTHDDSLDLIKSHCTINQIKYRLYPTYKILARDYRLCGITSSTVRDHKQQQQQRRRRRRRLASHHLKLESNGHDVDDNDYASPPSSPSSSNNNSFLIERRGRQNMSHADRHVQSDSQSGSDLGRQIFMLNIRFPVIKSLRTEEDTYATLICSPEQQSRSKHVKTSNGHSSGSEDNGTTQDSENEDEELASDDSVAHNRGNNNNLRDETVLGDESRRQLRFMPHITKQATREPLLIQDRFNITTNIVLPVSSKQANKLDDVNDYKSSTSSADASKNHTDKMSLSASTPTVVVPLAADKPDANTNAKTKGTNALQPTDLNVAGKFVDLRQPEHNQQPSAKLRVKPTQAILNLSATDHNSNLRNKTNNDDSDDYEHARDHKRTIQSGWETGDVSVRHRRQHQQQSGGSNAVVAVGLSGNKLSPLLSSEIHQLLISSQPSSESTSATTIRAALTATRSMQAKFNDTIPPANQTTKQMMQTVTQLANIDNITEYHNDTNNTIIKSTKIADEKNDKFVDVDRKVSSLMRQTKTFEGTETHQLNLSIMALALSIMIVFVVFAIIIELNISSCR